MEEQRSQMRIRLQEIILDGIKYMGSDHSNCSCGWTSRYNNAYMGLLISNQLWPSNMLDITVSQAIERIKQMNDPPQSHAWTPCDYRWHPDIDYRNHTSPHLDNLKRTSGLCIDCVRSSIEDTKHTCRIQH